MRNNIIKKLYIFLRPKSKCKHVRWRLLLNTSPWSLIIAASAWNTESHVHNIHKSDALTTRLPNQHDTDVDDHNYGDGAVVDLRTVYCCVVQSGVVDKWYSKGPPSCLQFDERFQYYTRMILEVESMPLIKDQGCIRLHMGPLADGIKKHAQQWIKLYGQMLHESASQKFGYLQELLAVTLRYTFHNGWEDRKTYTHTRRPPMILLHLPNISWTFVH